MASQEKISQRAFEIWEAEGRPEGRDLDHWLRAEAELGTSSAASATRGNGSSPKKAAAGKPAAKSAAPARAAQPAAKQAAKGSKAAAKI